MEARIGKTAQKRWEDIIFEEKKHLIDTLFEDGERYIINLIYKTCDSSKERGKYARDDEKIREYIKFKQTGK